MDGLRPVQDRQRAVRGRGVEALGGRRHHRQRADARAGSGPTLQRYVTDEELDRLRRQSTAGPTAAWKTPEQGAATSVLLAASPLLDGVSGRYFEDCNEAGPNQPGTRRGVAAYALDPAAAAQLWQVSVDTLAS